MKRPDLQSINSVEAFASWYWLKAELVDFCRQNGLRVSGNKADLDRRIRLFLKTGKREESVQSRRPAQSKFDWHCEPLTLDTKITDSYKNTQNMRRFMKTQVGESFRFSIPLMKWIKENEGKMLRDVVAQWHQLQAEKKDPAYQSNIPPSNEYNQYVRDFMADNPGKTLQEARQC